MIEGDIVVMTTGMFSVLAVALLVYAAMHDFVARTIPNWLPAVLLALGVLVRLLDRSLVLGLAVALVTFLILLVVWLARGIGGGDVKLWTASALLIPPHLQPELKFFFYAVIAGGLLGLIYLALGLIIAKPRASREGGIFRRALRVEAWRISHRGPLPYAFAIASGAILTLLPLTLAVR
jgi:prepilin peptidase CpaA